MTIYVVIGAIGLILLVVTLVGGELLDGVFDGLGADWFSGAALAGFLAAFGFCAALFDANGSPTPVSVGLGVGAGVLVGGFATWLTRLLRGGATDDTPRTGDVIGYDGTVVSSIPADGFGVITVSLGGHLTRFNARCSEPVSAGAAVTVVGVLSPTAVSVAPL